MENQFLEDINTGKKPTIKRMIVSILLFILGAVVVSILVGLLIGITLGLIYGESFTEVLQGSFGTMLIYIDLFASQAGAIGALFLFVKFFEKRKISTLGFYKKDMWKQYGIGFVGGAISLAGIVAILALMGQVKVSLNLPSLSLITIFIAILILVAWVVQGAAEEILCRGYLLPALNSRFNLPVAVIVSSSLFAVLHLLNDHVTLISLLNLALVGVVFAFIALKQRSLWGACAYHTSWNLVQGNIFGIEVSGNALNESLMITQPIGSDLWTGGPFGVEGSLITTIVLAGTAIWLYVLIKKDKVEGNLDQDELEQVEQQVETSVEG